MICKPYDYNLLWLLKMLAKMKKKIILSLMKKIIRASIDLRSIHNFCLYSIYWITYLGTILIVKIK